MFVLNSFSVPVFLSQRVATVLLYDKCDPDTLCLTALPSTGYTLNLAGLFRSLFMSVYNHSVSAVVLSRP
jgi:hypothetical protein